MSDMSAPVPVSEDVDDDDSDAASVVVGTSSSTVVVVVLSVDNEDDCELHCDRTFLSHSPPSPATPSLHTHQQIYVAPKIVGKLIRDADTG